MATRNQPPVTQPQTVARKTDASRSCCAATNNLGGNNMKQTEAVEQLKADLHIALDTAVERLFEAIVVTGKIVAAGHALSGEMLAIKNKPLSPRPSRKAVSVKSARKPRRRLSADARKRIADAQ